jgi:tetratricopeptide (TPR) repeat protein
MDRSKYIFAFITAACLGLAGAARPGDAAKAASGSPVIEDWFGKEGGPYMDAGGTTASVTFLDKSGERWLKLTFNIVSGGFAGVWQNLSPGNVADLSHARSLKFKARASYTADGGLCMNDANHVNYIAGFKFPTGLKEVLVPFSTFIKNPGYTPPNAVTGHPMDFSQASYIWLGTNTPGKGEFVSGPVMASAVLPYEEKYKEALGDYKDSGGKLTLPEDAKKYFGQGKEAEKKRAWFEAESFYYQAILLAPWYADPHFPLAVLLAEKEKDYEAGIAEMRKFIELAPESQQEAEAEHKIREWDSAK